MSKKPSDTDRILHEVERVRVLAEKSHRLDIYLHFPEIQGDRLERIETALQTIIEKENQQMALSEELLAEATAQTTLIGSIKTLVQGMIDSGVIPPAAGQALLAAFSGNRVELAAVEAALLANVPTPPPTP